MHMLGEGVPKDLARSYYWLSLAVAQEQEQAGKLLDKVRGQMDSAARTKIDQEVAAFRPK